MSQETKQFIKITPEAAAHQPVPEAYCDEHILKRLREWFSDKDKGLTYNHILTTFGTYPARAMWLLHKCYFDNRDIYDLRRGWYVEREVPEEYDEDGNLIEHVGYIATEDQVKEMEKTGKAVKKRLYCIHPPKLDSILDILDFDLLDLTTEAKVFVDSGSPLKPDPDYARKRDEAKLRAEERYASCFSPEKPNISLAKPKDEVSTPSPNKKRKVEEDIPKSSPTHGRRRLGMEVQPKTESMMDDVYTRDEDDAIEIKEEPKTKRAGKKSSSRASALVKEEPHDVEMDESTEDGPSEPHKIKELKTVLETTRDAEGFLVTSQTKILQETGATTAHPPPKKKASAPATAKKVTTQKHQSCMTDFFKKK